MVSVRHEVAKIIWWYPKVFRQCLIKSLNHCIDGLVLEISNNLWWYKISLQFFLPDSALTFTWIVGIKLGVRISPLTCGHLPATTLSSLLWLNILCCTTIIIALLYQCYMSCSQHLFCFPLPSLRRVLMTFARGEASVPLMSFTCHLPWFWDGWSHPDQASPHLLADGNHPGVHNAPVSAGSFQLWWSRVWRPLTCGRELQNGANQFNMLCNRT